MTQHPPSPGGDDLVVSLRSARACGLSWDELGLARRRFSSGLGWGGAAVALVAVGYAVALAVPALRPLLADDRSADLGLGELAGRVLVRVPLGAVVWEEVAFRGVLLAALARMVPVRVAAGLAAAVFGLCRLLSLRAGGLIRGDRFP